MRYTGILPCRIKTECVRIRTSFPTRPHPRLPYLQWAREDSNLHIEQLTGIHGEDLFTRRPNFVPHSPYNLTAYISVVKSAPGGIRTHTPFLVNPWENALPYSASLSGFSVHPQPMSFDRIRFSALYRFELRGQKIKTFEKIKGWADFLDTSLYVQS